MIYNSLYYPTTACCMKVTISLNKNVIVINSITPKFQKKIYYDNCFGVTFSKEDVKLIKPKKVADYINYLQKEETTCVSIHSLKIPDTERIKSKNNYEILTFDFETKKEATEFYNNVKNKINIKEGRNLLCILNPMSGSKKSSHVYQQIVKPMFKIANIQCDLRETRYQCHCEKIVNEIDLNQYDGIISIGGDGLFHELINGILTRDDWEEARYMPVGLINSGTSNALNINFDIATTRHSILNIIKGNVEKFDVLRASQGEKVYFSHLSLTWGVMADTDIQSDKYRFLGKYKYYFVGAFRIIFVNKYPGHLYYLPENTEVSPTYEITTQEDKILTAKIQLQKSNSSITLTNSNEKEINSDPSTMTNTTNNSTSSNSDHEHEISDDLGSEEVIMHHSKKEENNLLENSRLKNISNETLVSTAFEDEKVIINNKTKPTYASIKEEEKAYDKNHVGLGPKARYTNDEQVTEENLKKYWKHSEMKFTSLAAVNYPFLSHDMLFGPEANPQDGLVDLIYTDTPFTYSIMLDDSHGTYYKGKRKDAFHVEKTKAFILIPDNTEVGKGGEYGVGLVDAKGKQDYDHGILDLDGEILPYEPIRVEVLPKLMSIYAPEGMDMSHMGKTFRKE